MKQIWVNPEAGAVAFHKAGTAFLPYRRVEEPDQVVNPLHPVMEVYKSILNEVQTKILEFQERCVHPDETLLKKMEGSTGNYDPAANGYWANFWCQVCDKRWTVDSDDDYEAYCNRGIKVSDFPS